MASGKPASSLFEVLLDVRPAADFRGEKGSHIPGAVNVYWMENQISHEDKALKSDAELRKHRWDRTPTQWSQ